MMLIASTFILFWCSLLPRIYCSGAQCFHVYVVPSLLASTLAYCSLAHCSHVYIVPWLIASTLIVPSLIASTFIVP